MTVNAKDNPSVSLVRINEGRIKSEEELITEIEHLYTGTRNLDTRELGQKNLVYFTINNDYKYIELFIYCLRSVIKNSKELDFDLLVICPEEFEKRINELIKENNISLLGINLHFFRVDMSVDGVQASMNKLLIYKWELIKEYRRVLFLDVDILARSDISELFKLELNPCKLYSTIHNLSQHLHQTVFHKLISYSTDKMTEFRDNSIFAFNAGQFLFVNSDLMLQHFHNVHLISREWSGSYFFEQSFMNHYFNWFCISDAVLLFDKIQFLSVHMGERALTVLNKDAPILMHFAGHACNAEKKIEFIKTFFFKLI
jgi:lipopolysaccharide biosynthesis glycosyltransferase